MKKNMPIPLMMVLGFIILAVMPFLLVVLFFGACFGFEKEIESFFKPDKES